MKRRSCSLGLSLVVTFIWLSSIASATVSMVWETVGAPGNACDPQSQGCFGDVMRAFRISKYEVTNTQYTEFLNAVAQSDPNDLYHTAMGGHPAGGITRTGASPPFSYGVISGRGDWPVNFVSFYNALRFANWLHNGQPVGPQGSGTTEDGAYTITASGITNNSITRNPGARMFVPSEDEWYKAAYFDTLALVYFDYPTSHDVASVCQAPTGLPDRANCGSVIGLPTSVGSYPSSASPLGTYDQGGNIWEWNEVMVSPTTRGLRGGGYADSSGALAASNQHVALPTGVYFDVGFRVGSVSTAVDWVAVAAAGNADDTTGFGSVAHHYSIAKTETTNAQYADFLNAVADTDPNGLYETSMGGGFGGITRTATSGSYSYDTIAGRGDMPVNFVSFYDSLRFVNWLHRGQPTGLQGPSTTEDGAYAFAGPTTVGGRKPTARIFLPSEDEWYKAAYYDAAGSSYFAYPAGSSTSTTCTAPSAAANTANCGSVVGDLTPVGSYPNSTNPAGTLDQGGNIWEWNQRIAGALARSLRAGGFSDPGSRLASSESTGALEANFYFDVGFRVSSTPQFEWISIGTPGNPCDVQPQGCFGSVADDYRISKTEVTNAQYVEFLNAVAADDPNALYNPSMELSFDSRGGITRTGVSPNFRYTAAEGRGNKPVNFVSFWDAIRFANWLHNGKPTGAQDPSTTEGGAYSITPGGIAVNSITRNPGATVFVPSVDEWYKAAYYDAGSNTYFDYPAGFDGQTDCSAPGGAANAANCDSVVTDLTDVGRYPGSASPAGTLDQGGNVYEWNEFIINAGAWRDFRGGSFDDVPLALRASLQAGGVPTIHDAGVGFRVASLPPPVPSMHPAGIAILWTLLGLVGLRRLRR